MTDERIRILVVDDDPALLVETILIVDDQGRVRVVVREMLQMKGYTVLDTGDPQVALDLTKTHAIHLLLADVVMSGMRGTELARRVLGA